MRATLMWMSVKVVSGVRIVQCHAIIDVVIDVRVMQCHAIIDVVIDVRVMQCHASHGCCHWRPRHALSPSHGCCHWRPRHALSPSHGQFWIFHFSEFSTSCPNSHLVVMLYQFIITFLCSHFVHTFTAKTRHVRCGIYRFQERSSQALPNSKELSV